jgi:hypothetical protein
MAADMGGSVRATLRVGAYASLTLVLVRLANHYSSSALSSLARRWPTNISTTTSKARNTTYNGRLG